MQHSDDVIMFTLARETNARLTTLERRVKEGKSLYEARDFVSYLQWSRILTLLDRYEPGENLEFNGRLIGSRADDLLRLVNDQFQQPQVVAAVEYSQLEQINHNLSLIAAQVAKLG